MNTVKVGDTHAITFVVKNSAGVPVDLNTPPATVRLLAMPISGPPMIVLAATLGAGAGEVVHQLTGTLPSGTYSIEVETTQGGIKTSAPSEGFATLYVQADLG